MKRKNNKRIAIFESPRWWDAVFVLYFLLRKTPVYVVEPFHTYHQKKGIIFYPLPLPTQINRFIKDNRVKLILAKSLGSKHIYLKAADRAVEVNDLVYDQYFQKKKNLIRCISEITHSKKSENAFKIKLCDKLAEFFSLNFVMERIEQKFPDEKILFFTSANIRTYCECRKLLRESRVNYHEAMHTQFVFPHKWLGSIEAFLETVLMQIRIVLQAISSFFVSIFKRGDAPRDKTKYLCGITVMTPERQLCNGLKRLNFIVDGKDITEKDVVYVVDTNLNDIQRDGLKKLSSDVQFVPKAGKYFSHHKEWFCLLTTVLRNMFSVDGIELRVASITIFKYLIWKDILENIEIKHFITHCDFGFHHIGRNIALKEKGTQTWYYTDSMNFTDTLRSDELEDCRHPFWTYLYYDNYVTWGSAIVDYFRKHKQSVDKYYIAGCLWAKGNGIVNKETKREGYFNIAVYDSSYSCKGITNYEEGILFAEHILRLVNDFNNVRVFFKEKKDRSYHYKYDHILGPKLCALYEEMSSHPRIEFISDNENISSEEDINLVVSFPFTSTTYEALSDNKDALWHDAIGYYLDAPYGKIAHITTHSYDDLKERVEKIMEGKKAKEFFADLEKQGLIDPYRDGKAVERFREFLKINS